MNKVKKISLLLGILLLGLLLLNVNIPCLFKSLTHFPCPDCGMTRAFRLILNFKLIESFSYNILAIPLFISIVFMLIVLVNDIITNQNNLMKILDKIINKYHLLILGLLAISWIVNIWRGI